MVSRLRPLDLTISYDGRTYTAGESIDVTVEGSARRDCQVRQGRVDLVVEAKWTDRSTRTVEIPVYQQAGTGSHVQQAGTRTEVKETVTNRKENTVHGRAVFLEAVDLTAGRPFRHSIQLQVPSMLSPFPGNAKVNWSLRTIVNVAGARDIRRQRKIDVRI
jgi:hypothetical protein